MCFPRAAVTKYHKPGGLSNRNLLSHSYGSEKSKIKVSKGLVPSERCEENMFHDCLAVSGGCWQSWHSLAVRNITPISAFIITWRSLCVCLCPNFPLL